MKTTEVLVVTDKVADVVSDALEAFWASIAYSYPEAKRGDLSLTRTSELSRVAEQVVAEWVENNVMRWETVLDRIASDAPEVNGWKCHHEYPGTLFWYKDYKGIKAHFAVCATPGHEEEDLISVDVYEYYDDPERSRCTHSRAVKFESYEGDIAGAVDAYVDAIKEYLV